MAELLSVIVNLSLAGAPEGFVCPRWWGGFAHGLLMQVISDHEPQLAEDYHHQPGLKPYTVSDLIGATPRQTLNQETVYSLRFTSCEGQLTQSILQSLENGGLAVGQVLKLGSAAFTVTGHDLSESRWCGLSDYQTLSAAHLMPGQKLSNHFTFQLGSPTTFKHGDRFDPVPSPSLLFSGLLRRWNHWSSVIFPETLINYVSECLVTTRYHLQTRLAGSKDSGLRPGAVGRLTFTALHYDGYWLSLLHALGAFAKFAGVGSGVSQGMGQACLLSTK